MQVNPGHQIRIYTIFLSSPSDLRKLREDIRALIEDVVNNALYSAGMDIQLRVDMWEHDAPKRPKGDQVNDDFVARALKSHVTMVLLRDKLGGGTNEEFTAVLDAGPWIPELSVFRFEPSPDAEPIEIADIDAFCERIKKRLIIKDRLGSPDTTDSWNEIFRFVLELVFTAIGQPRENTEDPNELR
jgi:hypothetical protein